MSAQDEWEFLTAEMPADLKQAWHGARIAMGITKAMALLRATIGWVTR